ncbi:EndoU domain-containing protein [Paenibacillaceae sp. P-4]|uniref:EndoU domain-containing protein n=1 Tax=Paenibacillaceae bacterium P-4 TaxID=3160969 RepID=UPI0032E829E8
MSALHNEIGYESLRFYGPFQPQHIEKLQITRTINDHAYVTVSGMLSEEQGAACIGQNMEEEPIVIRQLDERGQSVRRLFHGIVTRLSVHCIRGVYTFELEAASHSYQMDIQIKKRSYQDIHRTYDDLVTTMIRKYKFGDAIDTVTNNTKLGTFVLQYEETDWAFLKRLAARFGSVLVPEVTAASPKVFFGMPVGKLYKLERDVSYQVRRTFHELETGKPGRRAGSYVTYVIESLQYYALGDSIALPIGSGKELVVVRAVTRMKDGLLLTRYDLQAEQDIRYARYENDQATGIALTGSVLQVQQDLVQLQLDIDPKQDPAKVCWFPVATRYAAEEHSGWYDMPEVGARVELYLPTSREHEAYVMDSRQHRHAQGKPDVKVWRHTQGSGVDMSEQELTLSTSGGFSITLHEGNGITVSSPGDVRIQGGHVKLDAGQELSLTAGSALYLTGGSSSMVLDGETDIKAPVVDQEGTVKAPVFVMDLPPVPEPPLMNIKDYEAAQAAAKKGSSNNTNTPTAKITNPADQKQADGLLGTESKLLGAIPMIGAVAGAVVGVAMGAALGGFVGAAVSTSLLASAAVPVRSTGTSHAGGGGAKGGLHPLKYLAGLFMQGLISQYEHEKAKDAYYSKWLLGKVFTSARHIASSGGLLELVQNIAIESNAMAQAYQQIPPEVRQRWKANYDRRYMAEQLQLKQEENSDWESKPAKKDFIDIYLVDPFIELVTGKKPGIKTQGQQVLEAQLISMQMQQHLELTEISSELQAAMRGAASADRIAEVVSKSPKSSGGIPSKRGTPKPSSTSNHFDGTGKNAFTYAADFEDHIINVQGIVRKKNKGVVGGHNRENFEKAFTNEGWSLEDCIIYERKHPYIDGITELKYGIPALDREGNIIAGELKSIPKPKTVYDPQKISDADIIKWGKEAMENGRVDGRVVRGNSSNGLEFEGYIDETTGKITNVFPIVPRNE